ncbi:hypothetical protein AVEN_224994-1 [Araneus ventricosus]|uniref:Uncharacterized protein n=2 Tax=Araneus ventricosus TaxID=182803 RepID=A0A4Y2S948_ARAVE|nr:hypothetical protein AVEN_224994-1 [Araneus ventricosus]
MEKTTPKLAFPLQPSAPHQREEVWSLVFFLKAVMSSRVEHCAAELEAGLYDLSFLYGLKNGRKRDVIDFCMKMYLIAKEYICPACDETMELIECVTLEDGFIWCCRKYGLKCPSY